MLSELGVGVSVWDTLDKDVGASLISLLSLVFALMRQDLDLLSVELDLAALLDGRLGNLLRLKLDVAKASALSVVEALDLAGAHLAKLGEGLAKLGLGHLWIKVLDEDVRLWIDEVVLLDGTPDVGALDLSVIELLGTSGSFNGVEELEETIPVLSLGCLVGIDYSLVHIVTKLLHVFV